MNNFSRATSAFVLMVSLLASSMAAVGQTTTPKPAEPAAKTAPKAEVAQEAKTSDKKKTTGSTTPGKKPLSASEDPAMIGKRNINSGIIAKMSGSTEKEVRMGREAAAEVDR